MALLDVENLSVRFRTPDGDVKAVNDVNFSVGAGEAMAVVGESGSGKSQMAFAMLGLLARNGTATGSVKYDGTEILNAPLRQLNKIRAAEISIVFQDPMTSLNPYMRVSDQMAEVLTLHEGISRADAITEAARMLDAVKIPDAQNRIRLFPHEFSGGMRQRVMIAMSLLAKPRLLIADEPTTALDVTVQAQIMALFSDLRRDFGMAVIVITHDLGVVAGFAEKVMVMYGGRIMEQSDTDPIFETPAHPYTRGLLSAIPRVDTLSEDLYSIPGSPPNMLKPPPGCPFAPRCADVIDPCTAAVPALETIASGRRRACIRPVEELS